MARRGASATSTISLLGPHEGDQLYEAAHTHQLYKATYIASLNLDCSAAAFSDSDFLEPSPEQSSSCTEEHALHIGRDPISSIQYHRSNII